VSVWRGRARTGEALVLLCAGGLLQRVVPMRKWSPALGRSAAVPEQWRGRVVTAAPRPGGGRPGGAGTADAGADAGAVERQVGYAVARAAGRLPWRASCLAEAFAGQVLLRQRGRAGVVVIGLRRVDAAPAQGDAGGWEAHAWLVGRTGFLTGGPAARGFTATSVFELPDRLSAADVAGLVR